MTSQLSDAADTNTIKRLPARSARLGHHHFAALRALAEGVEALEVARRYLGAEHGHEARTTIARLIDRARAAARQRRLAAWRLIGLALRPPAPSPGTTPTLEAFAEQLLGEWSEAELLSFYAERYGQAQDPQAARRQARTQRLRERQSVLLCELEQQVAVSALPSDRIDDWFEPLIAVRLQANGYLLLSELRRVVDLGGRWWRSIPAIGPAKASRIAALLDLLLPPAGNDIARQAEWPPVVRERLSLDHNVVEAWINARSRSPLTARAYRVEAERWQLFLALERGGRDLRTITVEDCQAYMDFLADVPLHWISRRRARRLQPGWAPFAGPLSVGSQRQAILVVASLHAWLVNAGYAERNPWKLIRKPSTEEIETEAFHSRAFTPRAWAAISTWIERQPPSPARDRFRFVLQFQEAAGLRPAELLSVRLKDLKFDRTHDVWRLRVRGKGNRVRAIPIAARAIAALDDYVRSRGLPKLGQGDGEAPLVANIDDGGALSYTALAKSYRAWLRRAITHSDLSWDEKAEARRRSLHCLRHTCATRATEREVSDRVLQQHLGHTSMAYVPGYSRAQQQQHDEEIQKAFS